MGGTCCKNGSDTSSHEEDISKGLDNMEAAMNGTAVEAMNGEGDVLDANGKKIRPKKCLKIRNTIHTEEIELSPETIAARMASEDPDLDALRAASAARAEANGGENTLMPKRSKGRKGTGFVSADKTKIAICDEVEDDSVQTKLSSDQLAIGKRCKDRKGTAAIKKTELLPIEDEDEEDE